MEYIVKGLLEVDDKAKKIINKAMEARQNYPKSVEEKKNAIRLKFEQNLEADMKRIEEQSLIFIENQKIEIKKNYQEELLNLEKSCEKNSEQWENEIVQRVLNSFKG